MKYAQIGKSGIRASAVAFGAFGIGGGSAWSDTERSQQDHASYMIHAAYDLGVNTIDTAPVYGTGQSETIIGKAIAGRRRDFVIGTKCGLNWRESSDGSAVEYVRDGCAVRRDFSPEAIERDIEESLKRLGTDYIDIYITHRQPPIDDVPEVCTALEKLKNHGKIRCIGISNASPEYLREYQKHIRVDLVQEKFSLLHRHPLEEYIPLCEKENVTFQTYQPLEGGILAGKYPADFTPPEGDVRNKIKWFAKENFPLINELLEGLRPLCEKYGCTLAALVNAWTIKQSAQINYLIGFRRMETLTDTVKSLDIPLSEGDCAAMTALAIKTTG